jgi:hypothetical protein
MTATFPARDRDRLVKSLKLLSSPIDGEALAAGRAAHRLAEAAGGWERIVIPPSPESASHLYDWRQACRTVLDSGRASVWEQNFCSGLLGRWRGAVLTRKQEDTLRKIHSNCQRATA